MTAAGVKETLLENQQSFIVGKMDMKRKQKRPPLVGASKGFYSLEKFGIVVIIGYAVFSLLFGSSTAPIQL